MQSKDGTELSVIGIPETADPTAAALLSSRLTRYVTEFMEKTRLRKLTVTVTNAGVNHEPEGQRRPAKSERPRDDDEVSLEVRAEQYRAEKPLYKLDFLVVPRSVREDLLASVDLIALQELVFEEWNLKSIEPFPQVALNFHGPPGTGKTLAAHALANHLGRKILAVSYAQIESKFHGDGPKNVEAVFFAAERDAAVLFLDEADSLLSKRLTNVQQGSEQAINSMRSQLLICLGRFKGVVIFATNLVENYDRAFESRVRHIRFELPDFEARQQIWEKHLKPELPRSADATPDVLAAIEGICGRDIKNAIIDAALRTAHEKRPQVRLGDLQEAVARIINARPSATNGERSSGRPLTAAESRELEVEITSTLEATPPKASN